jgi:hypothetical protein
MVDRFHAQQHWSDLGKSLYGTADARADPWAKRTQEELDAQKFRTLLTARRHEARSEEARRACTIFRPTESGCTIPSSMHRSCSTCTGEVLAGCEVAIGTRLKRAGSNWTVRGSNAITALRCCKLSGRFEDFWERRSERRAA